MTCRLCRGASLGVLLVLATVVASLATAADDQPDVDLTLVGGGKDFTNSLRMKLVRIRSGKFLMGAPKGEAQADANESPQHEVELTRDYYLAAHEVTQEQWKLVMGNNPSGHPSVKDAAACPVDNVSWDDAQKFIEKLNALASEKQFRVKYRLPTEAEWEYACRGGTNSTAPFNLDGKPSKSISSDDANFNGGQPYGGGKVGKSLGLPVKVGSYKPNALGLYDMHGNAWEWCQDVYASDYYSKSPAKDPTGPKEGNARVFRGASHADGGFRCRAAFRYGHDRTFRSSVIGFRVAASPR